AAAAPATAMARARGGVRSCAPGRPVAGADPAAARQRHARRAPVRLPAGVVTLATAQGTPWLAMATLPYLAKALERAQAAVQREASGKAGRQRRGERPAEPFIMGTAPHGAADAALQNDAPGTGFARIRIHRPCAGLAGRGRRVAAVHRAAARRRRSLRARAARRALHRLRLDRKSVV